MVGQPADGKNIRRAIECDGIVKAEALAGKDFGGNGLQGGIVGLKPVSGEWKRLWPCLTK